MYSFLNQLFGSRLVGLFFKTKTLSKNLEISDRINSITKNNKIEPTEDEIIAIEYEMIKDDEADILFKKAVKLESQKNFDQALQIYQEILEKYPETERAIDAESCIKAIQD